MQTRKSGILALLLGAAILGACEKKADIINVIPPTLPVSVTITGAPTQPIKKGATVQLIAIVNNNANQAVTWSLASGTGVVTVSASGLVTAVAPGTATIKAVSVADATASAAVSIQVADTGTVGPVVPGQPTVTISSVTVNGPNGLNTPVNPAAVAGVIDATVNVDIPSGVAASAVRVTLDGTEVCRQSFSGSGSADASVEAEQVAQIITCSINTARLNANGTPVFPNGVHTLKAEVLNAAGTSIASATFQPLTFANADVIVAAITTTKGPVTGPGGFSWRGGDVTVTLTPAIFTGAANVPTSITVSLVPSANAAIQGIAGGSANGDFNAGCGVLRTSVAGLAGGPAQATPTCAAGAITKTASTFTNNSASVTFSAGSNYAAGGVGNLEDPAVGLLINGLVASGNNYVGGAAVTFNGAPVTGVAGGNPLRLDNLAPRFTVLDITPATLGCGAATACYLNGTFAFSAANNAALGGNVAQTVDYGVDLQTTSFVAGTTAASAVAVTNPSTLPETAVSNTNLLGATTVDALGNSRTAWATSNAACPSASSTSTSATNRVGTTCQAAAAPTIQLFGVDLTPPTQSLNAGSFGNNSTDASATVGWTAIDAATSPAGPSGIAGIFYKLERITAAGTVCLDPDTPATVVTCGSAADTQLEANGFTVSLAGLADGYYRVSATPLDLAGNTGATATRVTLRDFAPPTVGGIQSPSTITGNTDVSFTSFMSDNVELGDVLPSINYAALTELEYSSTVLGTYGFDAFAANGAQTFVIPGFIRSIETTAGSAPTGAATLASAVNAYVRDVAGVQLGNPCAVAANTSNQNCTNRNDPILVNVQAGIGALAEPSTFGSAGRPFGSGTNNGGTFFDLTATTAPGSAVAGAASVCSDNPTGAAAGCAVNPTSITLVAQARGPALTFQNPFARVVFYAVNPATGRAFQVCSGNTSVSDNTTVGTRTWAYSCSWAPTQAAGAYPVFALGVDSTGRALMTSTRAITVTSD
jgi:hypothetical protein